MKPTPAPLSVSATRSFGRSGACPRSSVKRRREGVEIVSVAPCDRPAERLDLALEVAEVADLRDPRVRLELVVVDDHRDLAEPAVRRRLERLPELALLELAVAREHVDVAAPPGEPVGEHEAARLRDPHPERARVRHHLRRRQDVRVAGQAARAGAERRACRTGAGRARSGPRRAPARRGPSTRSSGRPRRAPRAGATRRCPWR